MKFKWELISKSSEFEDKRGFAYATERAKVYGGWLIRNTRYFNFTGEENACESMCFIQDHMHTWVIDEEVETSDMDRSNISPFRILSCS